MPSGRDVEHAAHHQAGRVLTPEAVEFIAYLHRTFEGRRRSLVAARAQRQARFDAGERPDFLAETAWLREEAWAVPEAPKPLADRRVEITGPVDRKMMINALNSGAKVFMADFEDANSPTWANVLSGQVNLQDAVRGEIELVTPAKAYRLADETATLVVRPRGWHLLEKHFNVDGARVSASLFDFGLYAFHNGRAALSKGFGPYYYLPKLEGHLEARLWEDVISAAETALGLDRGSVRVTVLIETVTAAFEMDEILYELRDHICGLNAGRWDYIFSIAKRFRSDPAFVLPDRSRVTMTTPFMRAYTELLVKTCHRRGAHAIGGMAAFIPNRAKPDVTERALAKVAEDKKREAADGFDGTWVAHPDLVPTAAAEFDAVLGERPNQLDRQRPDVSVEQSQLLGVEQPRGGVTLGGLQTNISVGVRYLASWLSGTGAAAIDDLMEDAATAEISRAQVWQWVHHGIAMAGAAENTGTGGASGGGTGGGTGASGGGTGRGTGAGTVVSKDLVYRLLDETVSQLTSHGGYDPQVVAQARGIFEQVALGDEFVPFFTLPAYDLLA